MLTRTATHALGVLRRLASDPDARMSADALAAETGIPRNYLSKILNELRKRQIVDGEKGWGGGFRLRARALDRPIREIVEIFEGRSGAIDEGCIFGFAPCRAERSCALHPFWERIRGVRDEMLGTTRVRDLPQQPRRRKARRARRR
jgi:Rrf2 family protein